MIFLNNKFFLDFSKIQICLKKNLGKVKDYLIYKHLKIQLKMDIIITLSITMTEKKLLI
jgi:hypothetical protein